MLVAVGAAPVAVTVGDDVGEPSGRGVEEGAGVSESVLGAVGGSLKHPQEERTRARTSGGRHFRKARNAPRAGPFPGTLAGSPEGVMGKSSRITLKPAGDREISHGATERA